MKMKKKTKHMGLKLHWNENANPKKIKPNGQGWWLSLECRIARMHTGQKYWNCRDDFKFSEGLILG